MEAEKLCLVILTITVPVIILLVVFARVITGVPLTPEGANLLQSIMTALIPGVFTIIGYKYGKNDNSGTA